MRSLLTVMPTRFVNPNRPGPIVGLMLITCLTLSTSGCHWFDLVSTNGADEIGNSQSTGAALSGDGRYVAFRSLADNLVPGDTNGAEDIFVRDTALGATTRVSVDSAGVQSNPAISVQGAYLDISADGRYVVFESNADNLVSDDTNGAYDVFVRDRDTGVTSRVNIGPGGVQDNSIATYPRFFPTISDDGRYVAFSSYGSNLDGDDTDTTSDVFVHDRQTGITTCVSVDTAGNQVSWNATTPRISGNGRYTVFAAGGIYVHDLQSGSTTLVSVDSAGNSANNTAATPDISADGRYVAFVSAATNLVAGDTNAKNFPVGPSGFDTFVHDRTTGITTRASVDSSGNQWPKESNGAPSFSADGRFVAFKAGDIELIYPPGFLFYQYRVFVYDQQSHTSQLISQTAQGEEKLAEYPAISADGRYVAFESGAENFIPPGQYTTQRNIFQFAYPRIAVTGIVPNKLPIGATTPVTISGANFRTGVFAGTDATISNLVIVNGNTITANITVPAGKTPGARNVGVFIPGTGPGGLTGSLVSCAGCITFF
jgi:Tol biopolymer transport system component